MGLLSLDMKIDTPKYVRQPRNLGQGFHSSCSKYTYGTVQTYFKVKVCVYLWEGGGFSLVTYTVFVVSYLLYSVISIVRYSIHISAYHFGDFNSIQG